MRSVIPLILRLLMNYVNLSTNLASHFFDLVIGKILTSRLSLSKHLAHNLGNLLLLGKIGVFHNRRNASSRLLLLISKHLILCIYLVFRILARSEERRVGKECRSRWATLYEKKKRYYSYSIKYQQHIFYTIVTDVKMNQ